MYESRGRKAVGDLGATIVTILQAPLAGIRLNRDYDTLLVWLNRLVIKTLVFLFIFFQEVQRLCFFLESQSLRKKGSGTYFHNLLKSEDPDAMTTHKACGVLLYGKTIVNRWIGYNNQ